MPPNRVTDISSEDIPTLDVSQIKLSDAHASRPNHEKDEKASSLSYWDWPADSKTESLQQTEKARFLTSANHIQENLVQAAALAGSLSPRVTVHRTAPATNDDNLEAPDYWDMPCREPQPHEVPAALHQHLQSQAAAASSSSCPSYPDFPQPQSYWDWPAGKKEYDEACLHRVLDAARARHLTSATAYEAQLQQEAEKNTMTRSMPLTTRIATPVGYWDF